MRKITLFLLVSLFMASCSQMENEDIGTNPQLKNTKERFYAFKEHLDSGPLTRGVFAKEKRWETGQTIKIKFLNGSSTAQNKVKEIAKEWSEYANIKFGYVTAKEQADVRISFVNDDDYNPDWINWSYIGTDSKIVPSNNPNIASMNIAWGEEDIDINDPEFRASILQLYGLMLGLNFEHNNPNASISWNISKLKRHFSNQGWDQSNIDSFIERMSIVKSESTEYDEESIMVYSYGGSLSSDGYGKTINLDLSDKDKLLIGQMYPYTITPDDYESLPKTRGSIFHVFDNKSHGESLGFANWDWDLNISTYDGEKGPCQGTYNTISVDEYYWTTHNLIAPVSTAQGARGWWTTFYDWMDLNQENINQILNRTDVSLYQYYKHYGTLFSQYDGVRGYKTDNAYKIYDKRTDQGGTLQTGWDLPNQEALLQLIGECPRTTGDFWVDLKDFIFCSPKENTFGLDNAFYKNKNISELSIVPNGCKINIATGKFYDQGNLASLMTKEDFFTRFIEASVEDTRLKKRFDLQVVYYHFAGVRYVKAKTDKELGYKMYIDEPNDKVVMLDESEYSSLPELPRGLERGISLRYANRKNRIVLKKWSEIQVEAKELRTKFTSRVG